MVGSLLLAVMLLLALIALLCVLMYILCYKRRNKTLIEEVPAVTVPLIIRSSCGFYVPLDTKWVISETFSIASLFAWCWKKTKPNTTKARIRRSKEMY